MAVLTDANLKLFKKNINTLQAEVNMWTNYLQTASTSISKGTGSRFRTEYAKGKKATENIQAIIDILTSQKADLDKLVKDANTYYTKSYNASKK